ncbi:14358_t:CDS:2 [Funneliformis geosporum]|nr:14358_t:CDS:2 [Funneliformis geosporum]
MTYYTENMIDNIRAILQDNLLLEELSFSEESDIGKNKLGKEILLLRRSKPRRNTCIRWDLWMILVNQYQATILIMIEDEDSVDNR